MPVLMRVGASSLGAWGGLVVEVDCDGGLEVVGSWLRSREE